MHDSYIQISDNSPNIPPPKLLIIGYISQLILYILIVVYCILSPSAFSTISLMFMLISFAVMIATPYYVRRKNQSNQSIRVYAYPVERILWTIFLVLNIGFFIFKLTMYLTGQYDELSTNMQQFLQLQSLLNMFLPLLLLPFIGGSLIIRTKTRDLTYFKHQVNKLITIPIFLFMGILVLMIEIFSISLAGFLFFICMMMLFVQRKIDFGNFLSWLLVLIVQVLCLIFLATNFLTTTSLISSYQNTDMFQFYGINGFNNFMTSSTARGYIICLILVYIVSCLVQRIFVYNKIWLTANTVLNLGEIKQQHLFLEQGVAIDSLANRQTDRRLVDQFGEEMSPSKRVDRYSLQEFELPAVESSRSNQFRANRYKTQMQNDLQQPMLKKKQSQPASRNSIQPQKSKLKKKKPFAKQLADKFLIGINKFVDFIYSTQFSLRFTEVMSIIIIQRYNNVYSFVTVLWLAVVASTERVRLIYLLTLFILLPVEIGNYVILYVYNAPQSPIDTLSNLEVYGFQKMQLFWLDIIIYNVYLFYMVTFLLAASRDRSQNFQRKSTAPNSNFFILMIAFCFRYSYLLTIGAMFFLGFSKVTLMNLVYIVLFLVFFSSGQNVLIEIKTRNNKQVTSLTTFSRKYWFMIVYYTLLCIIAKYVYFLFFPDKYTQALQPTGINQEYSWSFNFSLSSICLSNTTPLFIIFLLSQAQIIIYRSAIYLNYSFSLVNQITDIKTPRKNKFRIWLNVVTEIVLQFYYQALWYVSGLIILACSFRWNILSLCIIIVTCIGLMNGFNKPMLAFIVFMDLAEIIINYLVLFTTYEVSQNFIGENGVEVIDKISLFLGLIIRRNYDLTGVFAFNIVIFYFGVESYALKKILEQNRFNSQSLTSEIQAQNQQNQQQKQDTISSYEPTILEQESNDLEFAKNFNKNVIMATKKLYQTVLWKKYKWWFSWCRFLSIFSTDIITIFVLVCCLNFRLAVSMFYFLILYMVYYFVLFDRIGLLMEEQNFYDRIDREYKFFKDKQKILCDRDNPRSIITGEQSTQSVLNFIDSTYQKAINMRYQWRYLLWFYASIVTVVSAILTYCAQFITSDFYVTYLNFQSTLTIQNLLFILGFSVTEESSFFRQVYFYYFMIMIAVVERLLLRFVQEFKEQQFMQKQPSYLNRKQYKQLQDPINFIDQSLNFITEVDIKQPLLSHISSQAQQQAPKQEQLQVDFSKQSNLLIYFDYKGTMIKINYLYGTMMLLLRFYLLMMLINLYEKSNVFSFAYLFSVLFFWFQKLHFRMVRNINKIAIIILLSQYIVLLLDISPNTSSLPLPNQPNNSNLSILNILITNKQWISYLVVDFNKQSIDAFLSSFLISSILIFLTQIYFTTFFYISKYCITLIRHIYNRYDYIGQNIQRMPDQDTIYLNYENYKSWGYKFMTLSYQLLINNSYIVVSYLILLLLSGIHNYISLALVCFACVYIYLGIFTGFSEDKKIYTYTTLFFRIVSVILFVVLILITIVEIPLFEQTNYIINQIEQLANIQQIFLLFLIQIWLDLSVSAQFKEATDSYNNSVANRENVMIKCIAYQENKDLVERMLKRYKETLWFEVNLKDALDIIDQWHSAMYKKKIPEFENLKKPKTSPHIKALQEQIKKSQQRRPEQDESVSQKFLLFMKSKTSVALQYGYYQIMRYVVFNNHRLIDFEHKNIDIWDYVLENYQKLNQRIKESEKQLEGLIKMVQAEEMGDRMEKLENIKKDMYSEPAGNLNERMMGVIQAPKKIFINIKQSKESTSQIILFFVLSNFPYILSFFLWIYYMINPCLLSLPFIIYFFAFEIISDNKLTSLMLIYIFSIIIMGIWIQSQPSTSNWDWQRYLFYENDDGSYMYLVGYLFFVFILIFINEQIKKYEGSKFKHHHEAENRFQGVFRLLINEDANSKFCLWSLKNTDGDEQQKQCNPMQYFSQKIEQKPEQLTDCPLPGFFQNFTQGKTGIDLYPFIASVQIYLTIYLIFFYPLMTQSSNQSLEQSYKYFQFSSEMVIAVLTHVVSIVAQRRITLIEPSNPNKSLIKYWYTMTILALFLVFIYYIAPTSRNINGIYSPPGFLVAFAFFYFFYFFLSALQIRFGYKKYKPLNSMLTRRRQLNSLITSIFTAVPFLYELKLMMDYSFCQTSLKLFDWFRLFSIYLSAFKAKMQYYTATDIKLGEPQGWSMKLIGWLGFIAILLIIFGPMILFSGLNPIAKSNLVIGGALQLGIQIQGGNYFGLYSTSHFSIPPLDYNAALFYAEGFQQIPTLQGLTSSDIPQQFQLIQFQPFSDSNWGISAPNMEMLTMLMNRTIYELNNTPTKVTHNFSLLVKYNLNRQVTETVSSGTNFVYPSNGVPLNQTQLQNIYNTLTTCGQSTYLPGFYISLISLFTVGNTYKPRPIIYQNQSGIDPYLEGVYLTLNCNGTNSTFQTNNVYWALNSTNTSSTNPTNATQNGVFLNVLCDKYQNLIGGLGFTALYTSVILVVAGFIRGAFEGNLPQFQYSQNPKPDNIIQISQAIGTLRDRKQFRQQYLMFYQLVDIIRSPDLMKYLSGSYPALIEEADEKRKKKQEDKQEEIRKDKVQ